MWYGVGMKQQTIPSEFDYLLERIVVHKGEPTFYWYPQAPEDYETMVNYERGDKA